jgi:hypothetical protein
MHISNFKGKQQVYYHTPIGNVFGGHVIVIDGVILFYTGNTIYRLTRQNKKLIVLFPRGMHYHLDANRFSDDPKTLIEEK